MLCKNFDKKSFRIYTVLTELIHIADIVITS